MTLALLLVPMLVLGYGPLAWTFPWWLWAAATLPVATRAYQLTLQRLGRAVVDQAARHVAREQRERRGAPGGPR